MSPTQERSRKSKRPASKAKNDMTYRAAGVDIDAGNEVVDRIADCVKRTHNDHVLPESHGGFAGLFRLFGKGMLSKSELTDPILVGATDGVGTKLKIAFMTGRFDTMGIDLVAMCVNDMIVGGARPLFFLDYIGTGAVDPADLETVVRGVARGCELSDCALLGGETAEMPGFYKKGELDLAGFAVGVVERKKIIDGKKVKAGDAVIGVASSGVHSNGFSLVRRALVEGSGGKRALAKHHDELGRTLGEELLEPTRLYVRPVMALLDSYNGRSPIRAMAHITGGGLVENIPRVLPKGLGVKLNRKSWTRPPIFDMLQRAGVPKKEMDRVFNQGIGLTVIVPARNAKTIVGKLNELGEDARVIGEVTGKPGVRF